jgi:hypothetical protein
MREAHGLLGRAAALDRAVGLREQRVPLRARQSLRFSGRDATEWCVYSDLTPPTGVLIAVCVNIASPCTSAKRCVHSDVTSPTGVFIAV